ncbi:DUF1877 family protein [Sphingobium nicotianae]|uniref:DUF1877 family protein n=1 Tax=Sphingobium nicotianae TaxID=2782607 RepID=A0A9X1DGC6_9SPHN|nr:DUF1877 family protein [Sphingobium nicotianae]MBT2189353.1 DUF1877 family protein [Sphingobium nicotianae]
MSIICTYVRAKPAIMESLCADPDSIPERCFAGKDVTMIDIDRATDGLAWLASPRKRAEAAYHDRLMRDADWPDHEARRSLAAIDRMPVEDALAAIERWKEGGVIIPDIGLAAVLYPAERVPALSTALAGLTEESLRLHLDFATMDRDDVLPGNWMEEGEDLFLFYLLPYLSRLKHFYRSAADAGESVLLIWS